MSLLYSTGISVFVLVTTSVNAASPYVFVNVVGNVDRVRTVALLSTVRTAEISVGASYWPLCA